MLLTLPPLFLALALLLLLNQYAKYTNEYSNNIDIKNKSVKLKGEINEGPPLTTVELAISTYVHCGNMMFLIAPHHNICLSSAVFVQDSLCVIQYKPEDKRATI